MSNIRKKLVFAAINRALALTDHDDIEKSHKSKKQIILTDESLTKDEKSFANNYFNLCFDNEKLLFNKGTKRICEDCQRECLATLHCEHCVRNYLKTNFSNWTSENVDIDNLIQNCQMETNVPDRVMEWIQYDNLQNVKYLTEGGCSKIYTADWINGPYDKWNNKEKQLKRCGMRKVILKKLENVESASRDWFDEV
jgi:hypothetical protein